MTGVTPDDFLLAFHARHAGLTARAFGGGRCADGRSSYDLLADVPRVGDTVLDLGCGDGFLLERLVARGFPPASLTGVDMSEHELAAARARPALAGARLVRARAQALPLPDASVDVVLSHLAYMLMTDIEAVTAHVARVLRPGGTFATITGGGPPDDDRDGFALFLRLFRDACASATERAPRLGDRRTRHADGVAALLPPGFRVTETIHDIRFDDTAERVWDVVGTVYEMFTMTPDAVADLRRAFLAAAGPGTVPCTMRLRLVTAVHDLR